RSRACCRLTSNRTGWRRGCLPGSVRWWSLRRPPEPAGGEASLRPGRRLSSCDRYVVGMPNGDLPSPVGRTVELFLTTVDDLAPGLVTGFYLVGSVAFGDF